MILGLVPSVFLFAIPPPVGPAASQLEIDLKIDLELRTTCVAGVDWSLYERKITVGKSVGRPLAQQRMEASMLAN